MTLVQQRYSTRHMSRPGREAVHDEVEVALATEFSELNAMVREMSKKHRKLDNTIRQMNHSAQALEDTLKYAGQFFSLSSSATNPVCTPFCSVQALEISPCGLPSAQRDSLDGGGVSALVSLATA